MPIGTLNNSSSSHNQKSLVIQKETENIIRPFASSIRETNTKKYYLLEILYSCEISIIEALNRLINPLNNLKKVFENLIVEPAFLIRQVLSK